LVGFGRTSACAVFLFPGDDLDLAVVETGTSSSLPTTSKYFVATGDGSARFDVGCRAIALTVCRLPADRRNGFVYLKRDCIRAACGVCVRRVRRMSAMCAMQHARCQLAMQQIRKSRCMRVSTHLSVCLFELPDTGATGLSPLICRWVPMDVCELGVGVCYVSLCSACTWSRHALLMLAAHKNNGCHGQEAFLSACTRPRSARSLPKASNQFVSQRMKKERGEHTPG
jgi:hypothetical protein